jgi:hypothetical protein
MESGRIVMDGLASDLRNNEDVKEFYLGMGGGERKSFKDVKSYKRRKRWLALRANSFCWPPPAPPSASPPQGGNASGPAKPVPPRSWFETPLSTFCGFEYDRLL